MKKYNKNLYSFSVAQTEQKGWYMSDAVLTLSKVLLYAAFAYTLIILAIVLFGSIQMYAYYAPMGRSEVKITAVRTFMIGVSLAAFFGLISLVFNLIKQYLASAVSALVCGVVNVFSAIGQFTSNNAYKLWTQHIIPSALLLLFSGIVFYVCFKRKKAYAATYEQLSSRLYRALAAKSPIGAVSTSELEKAMNDYRGGPIPIPHEKKN